jgi:hypothetical protein
LPPAAAPTASKRARTDARHQHARLIVRAVAVTAGILQHNQRLAKRHAYR